MLKKNENFFSVKKEWSKVKDALLGWYLWPYFQKVLRSNRPVLYVDCFAGKGKFDDGNDGSPIIALDQSKKSVDNSNVPNAKINLVFIDLFYEEALKQNIPTNKYMPNTIEIIGGAFEEKIDDILSKRADQNVFLYLDPYGHSQIKFFTLSKISKLPLNSIELLLNFNDTGLFRECCSVMDISYVPDVDSDFFDDYFIEVVISNQQRADKISEYLGGDYWQDIMIDYKDGIINHHEAKDRISTTFKNKLSQQYKYVLDMPIRLKRSNAPKYRMIHATNHPDGCLLMADNMHKRCDDLMVKIQDKGQLSWIDYNVFGKNIDENLIVEHVLSLLKKIGRPINLNPFYALFFTEYGLICHYTNINNVIKKLESVGSIEVERFPKLTATGKKSRFWTEDKKNKLLLNYTGKK